MFEEKSSTKHNTFEQIAHFVAMAIEVLKCWNKLLQQFTQVRHCGRWASGFNI